MVGRLRYPEVARWVILRYLEAQAFISPDGLAVTDVESRIAALAARQQGVVARWQLLAAGLSPAAISRRVGAGRLRGLHRGVYLVGPLETERARPMAAVLSGGPTALLSHTSALALWGMLGNVAGPVHVTVPGSGRFGRPGIVFHRGPLADHERASLDGIPVTSPERTLVDAAGMLGFGEIERAVAVAEREELIGRDALSALPARYPRRPGLSALREIVGEGPGPAFTRSEAERRCLGLVRTAGLPQPYANVAFGPYELDLFWPDERVALEIDGRSHHSSRPRFEGDRRKDAWLRARGIQVVRLSWRQVTRTPTATAVQLGQILALARARSAARPVGPPTAPASAIS